MQLQKLCGFQLHCRLQDDVKSKCVLIDANTEIRVYTYKGATEFGYLYIRNEVNVVENN